MKMCTYLLRNVFVVLLLLGCFGTAQAQNSTKSAKKELLGLEIKQPSPCSNVSIGAYVKEVYANSIAGQTDLIKGDVITAIDGKEIKTIQEFVKSVQNADRDGRVFLTYFRKGEKRETSFIFSKTLVEKIGGIENVKFYPNPNNGIFNLSFESKAATAATIQLTSLTGQIVYQEALNGFIGTYNKNINLTNRAVKGLYLLQIVQDGKVITEKVVID